MSEEAGKGRSRWLRVVAIGCGTMVLLALVAVALVALNWEKVKSFVAPAVEGMAELYQVSQAVQTAHGLSKVTAQLRLTRSSGVTTTTLVLTVVNSGLAQALPPPALEAKGREIAVTAWRTHPNPAKFAVFQVVFAEQRGVGVTVSSMQRFAYPASDVSQWAASGVP